MYLQAISSPHAHTDPQCRPEPLLTDEEREEKAKRKEARRQAVVIAEKPVDAAP